MRIKAQFFLAAFFNSLNQRLDLAKNLISNLPHFTSISFANMGGNCVGTDLQARGSG